MQHLMSAWDVAAIGTNAHVEEAGATAVLIVVDELVEGKLAFDNLGQPCVDGSVPRGDVGCEAVHVLRGARAAHSLVERFAAVAAVHVDGTADACPGRIQHLGHEVGDVVCPLGGDGVVNAQPFGSGRFGEL